MNEKTHWRKILESEYLAGADLDDGNGNFVPIILTIKKAGQEEVRELGTNKMEKCLVIHFFESKKPMICNVTNAKAIEKATGTQYIQGWPNHKIKIGTAKVKAFGEIWDALRVKPTKIDAEASQDSAGAPTAPPAEIICADCKKAISEHLGATPVKLARATTEKYGRALCFDCSQIAKAKQDAPAQDGEQLPLVPDADTSALPFAKEMGDQ